MHPAAPACPYCGTVYTVEGREPDEVAGELAEINIEAIERQKHLDFVSRKIEERACRTLADWQRLAQKRGFKVGWAFYRYEAAQRKPRGGIDRRMTG